MSGRLFFHKSEFRDQRSWLGAPPIIDLVEAGMADLSRGQIRLPLNTNEALGRNKIDKRSIVRERPTR